MGHNSHLEKLRHECHDHPKNVNVYIVHDPQLLDRMGNCDRALGEALAGHSFLRYVADRFSEQHIRETNLMERLAGHPATCDEHEAPHCAAHSNSWHHCISTPFGNHNDEDWWRKKIVTCDAPDKRGKRERRDSPADDLLLCKKIAAAVVQRGACEIRDCDRYEKHAYSVAERWRQITGGERCEKRRETCADSVAERWRADCAPKKQQQQHRYIDLDEMSQEILQCRERHGGSRRDHDAHREQRGEHRDERKGGHREQHGEQRRDNLGEQRGEHGEQRRENHGEQRGEHGEQRRDNLGEHRDERKGGHREQHHRHGNLRAVSNSLNHLDALMTIARTSGPDDVNIIVEDDIIASRFADEIMDTVLDNLPAGYDIVLLGGHALPHHRPGRLVQIKLHEDAVPSIEAYVVSHKAAKALSQAYMPFTCGHNEHLINLSRPLGLNVYRVNNPVFWDGSKTGDYIGTINPEDYDLIYNEAFMLIKRALKHDSDLDEVAQYVASSEHHHPHFRYLIAKYYKHVRDFATAKTHFEYSMHVYERLFVNVWKLQTFMLDYMHCCKRIGIEQLHVTDSDSESDAGSDC